VNRLDSGAAGSLLRAKKEIHQLGERRADVLKLVGQLIFALSWSENLSSRSVGEQAPGVPVRIFLTHPME
jgi:hypothetical protein